MTKTTGQLSPADDSLEIKIEASPAPPSEQAAQSKRVRARTPNPAVDEVIHTGEIDTSRSLVVKSSNRLQISGPVEVDEDATEVTRIPILAAAPRRRRRAWLWLIAASVPAVAAIALMFVERPAGAGSSPDASRLEPIAGLVGATLDGDARAVKMRADAIASSSMLRAGVSTDASTLADMAKDKDLALPVEHGEVLEVFQISDAGRTLMLRVPADATALHSPGPGKTGIEVGPQGATLVAASEIPKQASGVSGEVVLSAPLDVEPIKKHVALFAAGASLVGLATQIVLIPGAEAGGNAQARVATTATAAPLTLAVELSPGAPIAAGTSNALKLVRYGCAALTALFVGLFVASLLLRRTPVSGAA